MEGEDAPLPTLKPLYYFIALHFAHSNPSVYQRLSIRSSLLGAFYQKASRRTEIRSGDRNASKVKRAPSHPKPSSREETKNEHFQAASEVLSEEPSERRAFRANQIQS